MLSRKLKSGKKKEMLICGIQHRCTYGQWEDESICSLCDFCFNLRRHILGI
jgi:hypothetical protein